MFAFFSPQTTLIDLKEGKNASGELSAAICQIFSKLSIMSHHQRHIKVDRLVPPVIIVLKCAHTHRLEVLLLSWCKLTSRSRKKDTRKPSPSTFKERFSVTYNTGVQLTRGISWPAHSPPPNGTEVVLISFFCCHLLTDEIMICCDRLEASATARG